MPIDPDMTLRMIDTVFYNGIAVGVTIGVIAAYLISWTLNTIEHKYRKGNK